MARKRLQPRVGDLVQRSDFSKISGIISSIASISSVRVKWYDEKKPYETKEPIKKLRLIERKKLKRVM